MKYTEKQQRISELERIIARADITEANGATAQEDPATGLIQVRMATCGTCGKTWNDALITERTPAPSGRCPFEYVHPEIAELRRLTR